MRCKARWTTFAIQRTGLHLRFLAHLERSPYALRTTSIELTKRAIAPVERRQRRSGSPRRALAERDAVLADAGELRAEEEPLHVDGELVRRHVRPLHIAELALVAEVDDLVDLRRGEAGHFGVALRVDGVKEERK